MGGCFVYLPSGLYSLEPRQNMKNRNSIPVFVLVIFLILNNLTLCTYGQKLEVYTGALYNSFYGNSTNTAGYSADYKGKWGYSIGLAMDSIKVEWHTLRIGIQYDFYGGGMEASTGFHGGGDHINGQIQKGILSLSIYPINIRKLVPHMQFSVGLTGSFLLYETFSGDYSSWSFGQGSTSGTLEDKYDSYSSIATLGLQLLINYRIPITKELALVPQYSFYFGLTPELQELPEAMKSIRNYFLIGLQKNIK